MQQDAEECLREMFTLIGNVCRTENGSNLVDDVFGFRMRSTLKCIGCDEEPEKVESDNHRFFVCHMGTVTEPISHLHEGVKLSLKEHVEKRSEKLGTNATWEKTSAMETLPEMMWVQFARFGYKQANVHSGTEASKVKHVRKCAFSSTLDVYDYATPELKEVLNVGRGKLREKREQDVEEAKKKIDKIGEEDEDKMEVEETPKFPMKTYQTGQYELVGVVSHQGRSADGGHYVGWVRSKKADTHTKHRRNIDRDRLRCLEELRIRLRHVPIM